MASGPVWTGHLALGFHEWAAERLLHSSAGLVHPNLGKDTPNLPLVPLDPDLEGRRGHDLVAGCRLRLSHDERPEVVSCTGELPSRLSYSGNFPRRDENSVVSTQSHVAQHPSQPD